MPTSFSHIALCFVTLPLLLLQLLQNYYLYFCHCYHYYHTTLLLNTLLQILSYPGVVELTTQLPILENILWLPLYRINKFGLNTLPLKTVVTPYTCGLSRCQWYQCRWRNWAQVGARWRSCSLCCFVSSWSVVEPSRGDRGSFAFGVVFLLFGSIVGPWLYYGWCMLYLCIVWSGDCKPTLYPFLIQYMGCVKITPLATYLPCGYASKSCSDTWEI